MAAPKKYSDELRERATRLALESGRPIAHVARDLGVHKEALRTWVRQAKADAAGGTPTVLSSAERERLKELEREVRELRAGQRDPQGRQRVFREGARRDPAEVSAFIDQQKAAGFAVELVCRTLGVSQLGALPARDGRALAAAVRDEQLLATIRELHEPNFFVLCGRRHRTNYVDRLTMRDPSVRCARKRRRGWSWRREDTQRSALRRGVGRIPACLD